MKEVLRSIRAIERVTTPEKRREIIGILRTTSTDIDYQREPKIEWKKGNIYFHSLQDTLFVARFVTRLAFPPNPVEIRSVQACFVKDLDDYIGRFPETEDLNMKQLFQTVFDVGTSVFWDQDKVFIEEFDKIYWELDETVIRPWIQATR